MKLLRGEIWNQSSRFDDFQSFVPYHEGESLHCINLVRLNKMTPSNLFSYLFFIFNTIILLIYFHFYDPKSTYVGTKDDFL